ncbi:OCIA domain-containing protein 1 isoform X2 [Battus philenor]|uniref:OCIA domain-containing protein 1 isoform X2 n=1 Tax=Battus philenor TaxID=42288 RepID=UPI0035D111D4
MNDANLFGHESNIEQSGHPPGVPAQPGPYKFSPDELRVLAECNSESFLQRSLPFGTFLGLGTYAAVNSGHLKPNPRFGAFPKITLAVVMGYFIGKLSYQQACAEKLMALPGSYIGQILRDRRDGKIGTTPPPRQTKTMFGATAGDIYSDAGPGSSLDLDTDRPLFNDDTYRPDTEGATVKPPDDAPKRPSLSYDDLRRKNRGEFADSRQDPYRLDPNVVPSVTRPIPPQASPAPASVPPSTNKYGDVME